MRVAAMPLLLLAIVLLLWLGSDEPMPVADDAPVAEGPQATPELAVASEPDQPAKPAPPRKARTKPQRTWRLQVHLTVFAGAWAGPYPFDKLLASTETSPVAGRRVRVELQRGSATRVLARGTTNEHGTAVFKLPALEALTPLQRASSRLVALPDDDDLILGPPRRSLFCRRTDGLYHLGLPARPDRAVMLQRIVVPVLGENLVTGRVVGPEGEPVEGAHVSPYGPTGTHADDTCTRADGRFGFQVRKGGRFSLSFSATDGRALYMKDVDLPTGTQRDLGDVRLEMLKSFSGRITYPDGKPVVGIRIVAGHMYRNMHVSYMPRRLTCEYQGRGLDTVTDAEGRFRLHTGPFGENSLWSVRADFDGDVWVQDPESGEMAMWMGADPGQTMNGVMPGHGLRVHVRDASGAAVPHAEVALHRLDPTEDKRSHKTRHTATDARGNASVFLTRGSRWKLQVLPEGGIPITRTVRVPEDTNESTLDLEATSFDGSSGVRVWLSGPDGGELMPIVLRVELEDGVEVFTRRVDRSGHFLELAPGAYNVTVRALEKAPWARSEARWQHGQRRVTVVRGKATDVHLTAAEAGHAHLRVRRAEGVAMPALESHATIHLRHLKSGVKHRHIFISFYGREVEASLGKPLAPGRWEGRLAMRGHRSVTRTVEVEAGALTRVVFIAERE